MPSCTSESECSDGPCIDGSCCPGSNVRSVFLSDGDCSQYTLTDTSNSAANQIVMNSSGGDDECGVFALLCLDDGCYEATAFGNAVWILQESSGTGDPNPTTTTFSANDESPPTFSVGGVPCV